jgi:hypothetical protein
MPSVASVGRASGVRTWTAGGGTTCWDCADGGGSGAGVAVLVGGATGFGFDGVWASMAPAHTSKQKQVANVRTASRLMAQL